MLLSIRSAIMVRIILVFAVAMALTMGLVSIAHPRAVDGAPAPAALKTEWESVPEPLWNAIADSPESVSFHGERCECLWVTVGTTVTDHTGTSYLAAPDGWLVIEQPDQGRDDRMVVDR